MIYQETSRQAWEQFVPVSASLDREIMTALVENDAGLSDYDIEQITGRKHQAVSANRRHLVERDLVRDSGRTKLLPNGREAILWVINENPDGKPRGKEKAKGRLLIAAAKRARAALSNAVELGLLAKQYHDEAREIIAELTFGLAAIGEKDVV